MNHGKTWSARLVKSSSASPNAHFPPFLRGARGGLDTTVDLV
ncbi:hypothetical protein NUACC26_032400 [Scytonema sp. NUACC26]